MTRSVSDFLAEEPTLPSVPRWQGERAWLGRELPGGYRLDALLESGPTMRCFRATQEGTGRLAAVKLLLHPVLREPEARRRFRDAARAASAITHPHVLTVYGFGRTPEGLCFLSTELLEGLTLRRLMDRLGLLSPGRALSIFAQVAAGVAAAHAQGMSHGDLGPEAVLLTPGLEGRDHVKVCDFGCGAVTMLTPNHEPPVLRDVHALGRLLYELCCGHAVSIGPRWRVPMPMGSLAPGRRFAPALEAFVRRLMAAEPTQRPSHAGAVLEELQALTAAGRLIEQISPEGSSVLHVSARLPMGPPDDTTGPVGRAWPVRELGLLGFMALSLGVLAAGVIHTLHPPAQRQSAPAAAPMKLAPRLQMPPPELIPGQEPAPAGALQAGGAG